MDPAEEDLNELKPLFENITELVIINGKLKNSGILIVQQKNFE